MEDKYGIVIPNSEAIVNAGTASSTGRSGLYYELASKMLLHLDKFKLYSQQPELSHEDFIQQLVNNIRDEQKRG